LRRNLAESKQRKKATEQSVAFFPDSQPLTGQTFPVCLQQTLFIPWLLPSVIRFRFLLKTPPGAGRPDNPESSPPGAPDPYP